MSETSHITDENSVDIQQQSHEHKCKGEELMERIEEALGLILSYGGIDGAHHKQWTLDQVVQTLCTKEEYEAWLAVYEEDGEYEWDRGIAP
jgi:hypothetical protein